MFKLRTLAPSCAVLALSACGGGGSGDTLYVSVSFPSPYADLFVASTIKPSLSGFDGHDQRCDQESGQTPPGMVINNDCTISGRPTQAGTFTFGYKVRADGTSGHFDNTVTVYVTGPGLSFSGGDNPYISIGTAYSVMSVISGWTAPAGSAPTWTYAIAGGSLPPGISLNPVTGLISGTPTTPGSYSAKIQATVTTVYGSYALPTRDLPLTAS